MLLAAALLALGFCGRCADVVIDRSQTFQTIEGWGHGGGILGGTQGAYGMLAPAIADPVNYQYVDYLVDDLGLTGTRTWEIGPRIDGTGIDHGDCDVVDWNLFQVDSLDASNLHYLVYFKNRLLASGFQPSFYSSPGYPTHASDLKPWVMNHPGERAQQVWASALYYKTNFGLNISYAVIYNEPSIASKILADDIKAVGPRLAAQGLTTLVQYAESVAPQTDWNYITPVQNDPDMWHFVGRISYHNYGTADPYRSDLRAYGKARGLTTAQTEMGNPTFDDLFSDLTLGGVSYWEVAYSASLTLVPSAGLTSFTPSGTYFRLRQVMHYVRPGAVRIGIASSDPSLHVLAFLTNGAVTTIVENTSASAQTVNLSGLPPGSYGLSRAQVGLGAFQELGLQTAGVNGTLTLASVPGGSGVTTLYPYSGPNHPPTVMTWGSNPGYVVSPATTATLSVTANDAELDPLTYHWSVTNQPAGASAALATPNAATTTVSGLTAAGTYVFNVDVRDGANVSSKRVYLVVYSANPPPVLGQTGFRIAAPYGLVFADSSGTTHANIELPTSSATLQVGIADLANSDFTGRGQWSVVSQPAGANATLGATTYIFVSIRANVSGMTVPGDYLFQVNVTNPGHPDLTAQILCTVKPASSAPVISSITASPASLTLPANSTQLTAVTSGSTNQPLRHWWAVKTAPAGARPLFDHQGATNTTVSNLVLPGSYTFTLRAFDDIHMTTQDKTVIVSPAPGAPVITSAATASVTTGASFTYTIAANNNPTGFNATNLPPGFVVNPATGVLTGAPLFVGTYNLQLSATNASGTGYGNLALTVKLAPPVITAGPAATPNPVQAGQSVAFSVSATDPNGFPVSFAWDFGDSATDTSIAPTHTYSSAGTYPVTFTVANDQGGLTTTSFPVVVTSQLVPGTLQFGNAAFVADRSDRFAQVSVSRLNGGLGAVQVDCYTTNGTARAGQDYVPIVARAVWANGEMGAKTVSIPVIDDDLLVEPDKTVLLFLSNPTGGASLGSPSNAVLTITANTKPNNGLIAHWTLDETNGTLAADSTGNSHDGAVANGTWTTGKLNNALHFNGNNSVVTVPATASLDMQSGDLFSIAFWVRGLTNNNGGMFLSKRAVGLGGYEVRYTSTLGCFFRANAGTTNLDTRFNANLLDGQWHHVVAVRAATELDTYADGIFQNRTYDSSLADLSNTNALYLGMQAGSNAWFTGDLDDVRLYRRALPLRLIQALAAANDDQDGDGLPDAWELLHLGNLTTANATTDTDGDGASDRVEFLAGTDPNSTAASFRIISLTPASNDLVITWRAGAGTTNVVQAALSPSATYSNISPNILITGNGDTITNYLDLGAANNWRSRFYRVRVVP
jgi:PKD repeat protein